MDIQALFPNSGAEPILHILSGSFRSLSLFLLSFSPISRTLSLIQTVNAFGPHQYLATNAGNERVYTTSWALPPILSSWEIERGSNWRVNHINNASITATSSYIILPPPYTRAYSVGGPTGEVHDIDGLTGGFREKIQQILFVREDELEKTDKTRTALRYGSHGIEFSDRHAFVPVLGTNSIEMYTHDQDIGTLTHIYSALSPRTGPDGPRHVKIHPNRQVLYCVTEHTNILDVYRIHNSSLEYLSSQSLLPSELRTESHKFRGDTLLLSPSTQFQPSPLSIFATTRGSTSADRGWLSVFQLDAEGLLTDKVEHFETPTDGGKANAIDLYPKDSTSSDGVWILLTDDSDEAANHGGGVRVLEWDGWETGGVKVVTSWPAEGSADEGTSEYIRGGSHAVWLD